MRDRPALTVQIREVLAAANGWLSANQVHDALAVRGIVTEIGRVRARLCMATTDGEFTRRTDAGVYLYRLNRAYAPRYRVPKRKQEPARPFADEADMPLRIRVEALLGEINSIRAQAAEQRASIDVCMGMDAVQRGASRVLRELGD